MRVAEVFTPFAAGRDNDRYRDWDRREHYHEHHRHGHWDRHHRWCWDG